MPSVNVDTSTKDSSTTVLLNAHNVANSFFLWIEREEEKHSI